MPPTLVQTRAFELLPGQVTGLGDIVSPWSDTLTLNAGETRWRIVEASSSVFAEGGLGGPFDLEVSWSGASGTGMAALVTASLSTRLSVLASMVRVRVRNRTSRKLTVNVNIGDGVALSTRNVYELRGIGSPAEQAIPLPQFAESVRLECGNPLALSSAQLSLFDGAGTLRSRTFGSDQPPGGVLLGGADSLKLLCAANWRLTFHLKF